MQGLCPKNFLVKIRLGSVIIPIIGTDFFFVGVFGAVSKHSPRPLSASSLCFKPKNANPKIRNGAVPRCTGIGNCFSRIYSEQGAAAFWRVTFTNCIRYFPTQAVNLTFKDSVKIMFPKYGPKQESSRTVASSSALRHHRGTQPVAERHRHYYSPPRLRQHRQT